MNTVLTGYEPISPILQESRTSEYANMPDTLIDCTSFGLTIRQHFAAMAMQGLMNGALIYTNGDCHAAMYAKDAVLMADALISELNKTPPTTSINV
jgi:hypothetical protein